MTDPAPVPARAPKLTPARFFRWWFAIVVLGLLAVVYSTPFGGWLQSFVYGTGARWENAYLALDTAEANLPHGGRERDRLLLANAMAEGEPPIGLQTGSRLHRAGTLARLRYEIFDENGAPLDTWEVRALVPNIGNGVGPFWREPCSKACADETARGSGTHLRRSGVPGIAEEYVLRMPVGQKFELRPTSLQTQDILDKQQRRVPMSSVQVDGKSVPVPSKILVTVVEACAADVRVGTAMTLQVHDRVPLPLGFITSRWAQLDGCGKLEPFPPPPAEPLVVRRNVTVEPPDLHALRPRRDARTGAASLNVDEAWLQKHNMPVLVRVTLLCRYNAAADQWQRLPLPERPPSWRLEPLSDADVAKGNRVAYEVPAQTALMWVRWLEQNEVNASSGSSAQRSALIVAGPVLCNDIDLGPTPAGKVATCVPFENRAEARFVPDPAQACGQ